MAKAVVIVNPKSGSDRSLALCRRLETTLRHMDYQVSVWPTRYAGHARELAQQAKNQADLVVALGGDGTVAEVANGLAYSKVPLLVVPAGTENIIAQHLGLTNGSDHWRALLSRGKPHSVDLGCVDGRYFLAVLGVGFDADVVHRVHSERSGYISHLNYFWPIWRTFWEYRFPPIRVEADGELLNEGAGLVFVGNMARYAIGLRILRDAAFDDGLLDLCIYSCRWQGGLLLHSANTLLQIHPARRSVIYRRCRNISISSPAEVVRVEVDGDPCGQLPIRVKVCPGALQVLLLPR